MQLSSAVAARRPLREGDVVLALVRDPSGDQEIVRLRSIPPTRRRGLDRYERSRLLAGYAERLRVPQRRDAESQWYSIVTILARRGHAVFGPDEGEWLEAWLYSNHLTGAFSGGLIVVTEHGWADQSTGWGGHEPRIHAKVSTRLRRNARQVGGVVSPQPVADGGCDFAGSRVRRACR
jgi:hypothetical protein